MRSRFDDLVYEYSDIDTADENKSDGGTISDTEDLYTDLQEALSLGLDRLALMNELLIKCRSRLDFCCELLEVAYDCDAPLEIKSVVIRKGLHLAETLFGQDHDAISHWEREQEKLTS